MASPFTDEDRMFPVYCLKCRTHIPRADSDLNAGYCDICLVLVKADQAARDDAAKKAAADQSWKTFEKTMKARGFRKTGSACRYCSEGQVWVKQENQSMGGLRAGGMLAALCFCPAILLALIPDRKGPTICFCATCRQEYTL